MTSIFSVFTILRAYSHGLSLLSSNRKLINFNLSRFSEDIGIKISMLMNKQGLVLADLGIITFRSCRKINFYSNAHKTV